MEYAMRSSGWPLLESAETFYVSSRARVDKLVSLSKEDGSKKAKLENEVKENKRIPVLETSPKWKALSEVLKEIRTAPGIQGTANTDVIKILIRVADMRTSRILKEYLTVGSNVLLTRLYQKVLRENKLSGPKHFSGTLGINEGKDSSDMLKERECELELEQVAEEEEDENNVKKEGENVQEAPDDLNGAVTLSLTQQQQISYNEAGLNKEISGGNEMNEDIKERDVELIILPTKGRDPYILGRTLLNLQPHYVIIYDADISAVRQIEVYQAYHPEFPLHVYFLMYVGSVEEQAYLTSLRREKESFEHLIQEKASMVVPQEREGRCDDVGHPELDRDLGKSALEACGLGDKGEQSGRIGGGRVESDSRKRSKVIVDMREFSSELPSIVHRRGMDVEPVTLQVGDYILTKDICVERKSVSDLIGSLQSGRLYNQATAMTRHYARPILLIEFDKDKPFALQGKFYLSTDGRNTDVASRLQLLTIHFPRLRLVWSPSPYATAELFEELKQGREEPDVEAAAEVGLSDGASKLTSSSAPVKFNSEIEDLVGKLPGISTKNIHYVLSKGKSLEHLLSLSQSELSDMLGNIKNGEALWKALHNLLQPEKNVSTFNRKGKKSFRGRGRSR